MANPALFASRTVKKFSRLHVLMVMTACVLPLIGALAYFVWWPGYESTKTVYSTFKTLQFALPILVWGLLTKNLLSRFRNLFYIELSRESRVPLARGPLFVGFISAIVFLIVGFGAYFIFFRDVLNVPGVRQALVEKLAEFGVQSAFGFCLLSFLIAVIHSLLEEYYWRGFVFVELQNYFSSAVAMWLSAFAFTLHHIVVIARYAKLEPRLLIILCASVVVFVCGYFWTRQFFTFRNIYTTWMSHIAADIVMLGIGYDIVYGQVVAR